MLILFLDNSESDVRPASQLSGHNREITQGGDLHPKPSAVEPESNALTLSKTYHEPSPKPPLSVQKNVAGSSILTQSQPYQEATTESGGSDATREKSAVSESCIADATSAKSPVSESGITNATSEKSPVSGSGITDATSAKSPVSGSGIADATSEKSHKKSLPKKLDETLLKQLIGALNNR